MGIAKTSSIIYANSFGLLSALGERQLTAGAEKNLLYASKLSAWRSGSLYILTARTQRKHVLDFRTVDSGLADRSAH
jgi:hypothetical protein